MGYGIWTLFAGASLTLFLFVHLHWKLTSLHKKMENSFFDVDRFMKKRVDVQLKWAETVAAYDFDAQGALAEITAIRDQFLEMTLEEKLRLCGKLDVLYNKMIDSAEKCPRLRTSAFYIRLHAQVDNLLEEMPDACCVYNMYADQLNKELGRFPANIAAIIFGFEKQELLNHSEKKSAAV